MAHAREPARLNEAQLARLRAVGERQRFAAGDVLVAPGQRDYPFQLLEQGRAEVVRSATPDRPEIVLRRWGPGDFAGEWGLVTGQAAFLTIRATAPGVLYEIPRHRFLQALSEDGELSDVIMRELLRRRDALRTGEGAASVEILGAEQSAAAHALRSWAERQQIAFTWLDVDDPAGAALSQALDCARDELPVVLTPTATIRRATVGALSDELGLAYRDLGRERDLVVVGAGPAGLAAAVYGASEGLSTLLLDAVSTGGQAAASSRIENYLGFPDGVSGEELTGRGLVQAQKFGATVSTPCAVAGLEVATRGDLIRLRLTDGTEVPARAVVIATGARYRRLALDRLARPRGRRDLLLGHRDRGPACRSEPGSFVVGGANSAGQAALFLAARGRRRRPGRPQGRASAGHVATTSSGASRAPADRCCAWAPRSPRWHGDERLTGVDRTRRSDGAVEPATVQRPVLLHRRRRPRPTGSRRHRPRRSRVRADRQRGSARSAAGVGGRRGAGRSRSRRACRCLFAVGDVRRASMKRVAAAVGEGSSAIPSVHRAIAHRDRAPITARPAQAPGAHASRRPAG